MDVFWKNSIYPWKRQGYKMETHWLLWYQKPNWLQHKELYLNQVLVVWSGFASPHMETFCIGTHHALMGSGSTRRPPRWMLKPCMFARKHRLQLAENHLTIFSMAFSCFCYIISGGLVISNPWSSKKRPVFWPWLKILTPFFLTRTRHV